jgi:hypothetical protein
MGGFNSFPRVVLFRLGEKTMKRNYLKYISITSKDIKEQRIGEYIILSDRPPRVPYYAVRIKIVRYESRYMMDRPAPPLLRRLLCACREAKIIFANAMQ